MAASSIANSCNLRPVAPPRAVRVGELSAKLAEACASDTTRFFHLNSLTSRSWAVMARSTSARRRPRPYIRGMKAVVLTGTGGPELLRVQEWPDPPVGSGDVRIAVRAAGLNFADTMARAGFYPGAPKPPCVLGYEVAGEVGMSVPTSRAFVSA